MILRKVLLILGFVMTGGYGHAQQAFDVGPFRAIEVQQDVQLDVRVASEYAVSARAISGDVGKLRVRQFLPWIAFDRRTRWLMFSQWRDDALAVTVETPVLNGLKAFERAQATFTGQAGDRLWVEAGDGGAVTLRDLEVTDLTLVGREGGTIVAAGSCATLTVRSEGAVVDARDLTCDTVVLNGNADEVILAPGAIVVEEHPEIES